MLTTHRGLVLAVARSVGTPINSVLNCASLLRQVAARRHRHFCLGGVRDSTGRLLDLIGSLLSCRQLSTRGVSIGRMSFGPRRLFSAVCVDFGPVTSSGRLRLGCRYGRSLGHMCVKSPFHVHRVTRGLLSGTLGFAGRKNVALQTTLRGNRLRFDVDSAKYNVDRRRRRHVFRRFAQLRGTRKRRKFNLKLTVAHGLILLLRKSVGVRDRRSGNDYFRMCLPLPRNPSRPSRGLSKPKTRRAPTSPSTAKVQRASAPHRSDRPVRLVLVSSSHVRLRLAATVLRHPKIAIAYYRRPRRLLGRLGRGHFSILLASVRVPTVGKFSLLGTVHALSAS